MNPKRFLSTGMLSACVVFLAQCALYDRWMEDIARSRNPVFVNSAPEPGLVVSDFVVPPPQPLTTGLPVVMPLHERLLSENTYEFGGRTYLEQRVVIRESPLETELRITQIHGVAARQPQGSN